MYTSETFPYNNWYLKIDDENKEIVNNWRINIIKYSSEPCNYFYINWEGMGSHSGQGRFRWEMEITTHDFKTFVLKEQLPPTFSTDYFYLIPILEKLK